MNKYGLDKPVREIYRHSVFSEIYYRFVKFILEDNLLVKSVLDYQMILDINNGGLEKDIFLHGIREKESTDIFLDYLKNGMNVVDIGANIGYYTLMEASKVGDSGNVLAIEPTLSSFNMLKKNCSINGFENIDFVNNAVGLESKNVGIDKGRSPNLNRISAKHPGKELVKQETLNNLVDIEPDIVRMDVQGYELEILKGMDNLLESNDMMLFIEVHPSKIEEYYEGDMEEFWEILSDYNFHIKYLVRHPPKPYIRYFFKREYPPKKVLNPDLSIEKTKENYSSFFEWDSVFRVFLKKSN